jgi:hypothetical protein
VVSYHLLLPIIDTNLFVTLHVVWIAEKSSSTGGNDDMSALLLSLCELLHHPSTARLNCICPANPCPLFALRVFWATNVLSQLFDPLLADHNHTVRTWALKTLWRLFQLFHNLPACSRYNTLELRTKRGISRMDAFIQIACPPNEMDNELINTLLQLLTGNLLLIIIPINLIIDVINMIPFACAWYAIGTVSQPNHAAPDVDLFRSFIKNPILLPSVFATLRRTKIDFRATVLKSLYEVLVGKTSTAELVLLQEQWQGWLYHLLTDVQFASVTQREQLRNAGSHTPTQSMTTTSSSLLALFPPTRGAPSTPSHTPNGSLSGLTIVPSSPQITATNVGSVPMSPIVTRPSSSSIASNGRPALNLISPRNGSNGDDHESPTNGSVLSPTSRVTSATSSTTPLVVDVSDVVHPGHTSTGRGSRGADGSGGNAHEMTSTTTSTPVAQVNVPLTPSSRSVDTKRNVASSSSNTLRPKTLSDFGQEGMEKFGFGFLKQVHQYALYNWEGKRVYHLFAQTLYQLRRFTNGWNRQSVCKCIHDIYHMYVSHCHLQCVI